MDTVNVKQELKAGRRKTAKPMLWISMVSMTMMFAGLISAYVISSNREDWVAFNLPSSLYISTYLIIISSITVHLGLFFARKSKSTIATSFLAVTFLLAIGFVISQFNGFVELKAAGLFFTGAQSLVSSSMLMVIITVHLAHIFVAVIVLAVMLIKQIMGKYSPTNILGFELGVIFWHFLDLLWIILFLFFYFNT